MNRWRLIALLALVAMIVGHAFWLPALSRFLDVSDPPAHVLDYVVPLPGDDNTRTLTAAAWVRAGRAQHVAILQGVPSPRELEGLRPPGVEVTLNVLRARGIDDERLITLTGNSTSTLTDLELVSVLLERQPEAKLGIVTNPYHLRRAAWAARRVLGPTNDQVSFIAAPMDDWGHHNWWKHPDGIESVLSEYVKLAGYQLRGAWCSLRGS